MQSVILYLTSPSRPSYLSSKYNCNFVKLLIDENVLPSKLVLDWYHKKISLDKDSVVRDKTAERGFRKEVKDFVKWMQSTQKEDRTEEKKPVKLSIPSKYKFLYLPREKMTPSQRRWKWV